MSYFTQHGTRKTPLNSVEELYSLTFPKIHINNETPAKFGYILEYFIIAHRLFTATNRSYPALMSCKINPIKLTFFITYICEIVTKCNC